MQNPERYGVAGFDANGKAQTIVEILELPPSNFAVTGLYFLDGSAPEKTRTAESSASGWMEITTLLEMYLQYRELSVESMGRGFICLDTGIHVSLLYAENFVRALEQRRRLLVGNPDEIA